MYMPSIYPTTTLSRSPSFQDTFKHESSVEGMQKRGGGFSPPHPLLMTLSTPDILPHPPAGCTLGGMVSKKFTGARCLVVTLFLVLLTIPVSASAALTESQISAIAGLLSSFNASATTVSEIRSILRGQIPPAGTGERLKLLRTLTAGMSGE